MIAGRAHVLLDKMPYKRTHPAAPQPAPVMDKYNGLKLASNSLNISHQRKTAASRIMPHADRLNPIHTNRVTLKGRFRGMDLKPLKQNQASAWNEALVLWLNRAISDKFLAIVALICPLVIGIVLSLVGKLVKDGYICKDVIHADLCQIFTRFLFL